MSLLAELKRRNVLRVVAAYLAAAWFLLQVADVLWPIYGFSDSSLQWVTNLLIVGLIPAVIISWVFEWTPDGLKRDAEVAPADSIAAKTGKKLDRAIIVTLALAVTFLLVDKLFLDEDPLTFEERNSIAVLPFANMSSDPEQAFFADGISEEILNLLARVRQLRVISRSSAFTYRGDVNIREVADSLDVAYVLEGSVRRSGDMVRITAQLIDAQSDAHVWSETWDRTFDDVFKIQDSIAAIVSRQLELRIVGQTLQSRRTDPELYALYLQVRYERQTSGTYPRHIETLEYILEQDPEYVPAIHELSLTVYNHTGVSERALYSPAEGYALSESLTTRALEVDPDDGVANAFRAWDLLERDLDPVAAARAAEKAIVANSNDTAVLIYVAALARQFADYDTAVRLSQMSNARDPLCAGCKGALANTYMEAGRFADAEPLYRERLQMMTGGRVFYGHSLLAQGRAEEALASYRDQPGDNPSTKIFEAMALYSMGQTEDAGVLLDEFLSGDGASYPEDLAAYYAWTGDADQAFHWLEKAVESGQRDFRRALRSFIYVNLRDDPRWEPFWDKHWFTAAELDAVDIKIPQ